MYNVAPPETHELPTTAQLRKSTLLAIGSALVILITIVLPAEYAIDPTRIGRVLGLTEMGEIKTQLAQEAAADSLQQSGAGSVAAEQTILDRLERIESLLSATSPQSNLTAAKPQSPIQPATLSPKPANTDTARVDKVSFQLAPGQGIEIKLVMNEGASTKYSWVSEGGPANFDTHGDAQGKSVSYEKGRGVEKDEGTLTAAFKGNHGWFWRNRNSTPITITLTTNGDYSEIKRVS